MNLRASALRIFPRELKSSSSKTAILTPTLSLRLWGIFFSYYGVATVSKIDKITDLFCRIASLL